MHVPWYMQRRIERQLVTGRSRIARRALVSFLVLKYLGLELDRRRQRAKFLVTLFLLLLSAALMGHFVCGPARSRQTVAIASHRDFPLCRRLLGYLSMSACSALTTIYLSHMSDRVTICVAF